MARIILTSLVLAISILPVYAQTNLQTDRSGYTTGTQDGKTVNTYTDRYGNTTGWVGGKYQSTYSDGYGGTTGTNAAVARMLDLANASLEEAVAAMYAYEMELPKISRSKIDGLKKFYGMSSDDATKYFEIHEEADLRHAQAWREILNKIPAGKQEAAFAAAVESLKAQNMLLDSVQEKYIGMNC